ncbi:MAG: Coenzyme F420 hydrogenase/dehydrogenase, beta subunit C-terminal domain [Candidatus Thermoplasmatota archaeon]|nr:Coenzyme F420 hydrogenase/dehydrogenase, beta subunit C-terminal domain [Candidatus Thermoplasmatota archaeon]
MNEDYTVKIIVDNALCLGCGTCLAVCNANAITLVESQSGYLVPEINYEKCVFCKKCFNNCPSIKIHSIDKIDFIGKIKKAYIARSTDSILYQNGQSGGVVTSIVKYLLDTGKCDTALVTKNIAGDKIACPIITKNYADLFSTQGSIYCPVPLNTQLKTKAYTQSENPVIVGLPCHFHGISNQKARNERSPLLLGLFCAGVYSYKMIDYLCDYAIKKDPGFVFNGISFRDKSRYGWPGDVSLFGKDNSVIRIPAQRRHELKKVFMQPRCYLCFDQLNVLADLSFGDPYGLSDDKNGASIVLARTERGYKILQEAINADRLEAKEVNVNDVIHGQTIRSRKIPEFYRNMKIWQELHLPLFDYKRFYSTSILYDKKNNYTKIRRDILHSIHFFLAKSTSEASLIAKLKFQKEKIRQFFFLPIFLIKKILFKVRNILNYK